MKLIIVDDHSILGYGLCALLSSKPNIEVIGYFSIVDEAKQKLQSEKIDVVVLDVSIPPNDGIVFCKWIKQNVPETKVLFLSMHDDNLIVHKAMRAGGNGYVTKGIDIDELYEAILKINNGYTYYSKDVESILLYKKNPTKSMHPPSLSKREREILSYIINGLTSHEIADKLFISIKTVDFHRGNLLIKLDAKNAAELVKEAVLFGIT
jgi:DNA-binding NarL/FixJ family response regulator